MSLKCNPHKYGSMAISIHWLTALLIVVLLGSGFRAAGMDEVAAKAAILRLHVPVAMVVFLLTVARVLWWLFADKRPEPVSMPRWQDRSSRAVHSLFYIVILGMVASGIGMMVLSGAGAALMGGDAAALPDFWDYKPRTPHGIGARALVALLLLHAGAALYHQFFKQDGLLKRMWFGAR